MKQFESTVFVDATTSRSYHIKLGAVICDAPARVFFKCVKTHTGYDSCERCVQHGKWCSKIVLPDLSSPLRTDSSFISRTDDEHHVNISPLSELKFGMISWFPLDYMYLICLGVVRRLINFWLNGPSSCKLPHAIISVISEKLVSLQPYISREFARISEFKQWKATELRLFLLYTSPIVLKGFLPFALYKNFWSLSVAMRILLSPSLLQHYADYAGQLLKYFVEIFADIYGEEQIVYNVHSVIHIVDDAKKYGVLDNCSSFKYESYLGRLKKLVRSAHSPCAQLVKHILENHDQDCSESPYIGLKRKFSKQHVDGSVFISYSNYAQFKQCETSKYFLSINTGDNCFAIKGKIGLIRNILNDVSHNSNSGYIMFEEFSTREPFFTEPLSSDSLLIYSVEKLNGLCEVFSLDDLSYKCVIIPYKNGYVVMAQLHF